MSYAVPQQTDEQRAQRAELKRSVLVRFDALLAQLRNAGIRLMNKQDTTTEELDRCAMHVQRIVGEIRVYGRDADLGPFGSGTRAE